MFPSVLCVLIGIRSILACACAITVLLLHKGKPPATTTRPCKYATAPATKRSALEYANSPTLKIGPARTNVNARSLWAGHEATCRYPETGKLSRVSTSTPPIIQTPIGLRKVNEQCKINQNQIDYRGVRWTFSYETIQPTESHTKMAELARLARNGPTQNVSTNHIVLTGTLPALCQAAWGSFWQPRSEAPGACPPRHRQGLWARSHRTRLSAGSLARKRPLAGDPWTGWG